jgi:hypothetical protein
MRDARLAMTDPDGAARVPPPALSRLSRYPTRTAPAVSGHADTRICRAAGHSGPLMTAQGQD